MARPSAMAILLLLLSMTATIATSQDPSPPTTQPPSPSPAPDAGAPPHPNSPPAPPPSDPPRASSPPPSQSPAPSSEPSPPPALDALHDFGGAGPQITSPDTKNEKSSSSGMSPGKKAGIAFGVIAGVFVLGLAGLVYKKRQQNIERSQYGYGQRREIPLSSF